MIKTLKCLSVLTAGIILLIGCSTTSDNMASHPDMNVDHPNFENLCSKCHTLDRVHMAHQALSQTEMKAIVERMAKKPGAGIEFSDIDAIVKGIN